ncbi:MAG: hypothetical protein A2836_00715 [Candidatus Taylorbacteria bacterium RIFCSPHIGHO2_01_FULL_45_63]|uniref:DNA-directed DNA polymerase n=1 Tax=Candidatus Taylorbacteria bacterium RIFCSPHIGHO2_02_FULL_45_35 TaxID=1802311 RepID=A0A1G2MVZ7_9BACT|nr:MAG: hypothetical protein A2836_00715 [Candidatus Taylorbacteria bacterium RIFCSPHIGHO2_01_FULL_45_63]OHA27141.1 MAG: hypothetical protein A3D56_03415 [Candidatus Taylorbacteria bacterium RIFCSPHIGHO2_02_FULL_45_35]
MTPKSTQKKRLILLDVHAILHRAYHALPDFSSKKGEATGGLYGLSTMLVKIMGELKPDYIVAAYDLPAPTYRHEAYDGYKAGRKEIDPELVSQIKRSRDLFKAFNIPVYAEAGFEADDILGTVVEKIKNQNVKIKSGDLEVEIIIASGDMDTLQLVDDKKVQVYTLKKGINDTILYDEEAVLTRYGFPPKLLPDYKGLRGDPSDNIIGIKGIGEKTATLLIQKFGSIEEMYKKLKAKSGDALFKKAGLTPRIIELLKNGEEEALFSKMLGTINRNVPMKFSLPGQTWKEGLEPKELLELFNELEFRSLSLRLKTFFASLGKSTDVLNGVLYREDVAATPALPALSAEEKREMSVMISLVDSAENRASTEDILQFTKATTFKEAKEKLLKDLAKKELMVVFEDIEKPLMPIVKKMEERGVRIDVPYLKSLSKEYHAELKKIEKKIWEHAGGEFNINSPKQLGEILFNKLGLKLARQKKTGGGALSTKESELQKMKELHPIISLILDYRELSKLLGTYIDTLPGMVDSKSRLHTTFLQSGTTTGRMSSRDPNLQNIPNKSDLGRKIREAFVAEKGYLLVAFDYSQIELRIAAFLSHDKELISIFKKGEDVHTAVAAAVFNVALSEVTKEMRRKAKVINFGVMYGMGINALRENLGTDRAEAALFYDEYFKKFSGLAKYIADIKNEVAKRGYTETFFGRRRYFEGIRSHIPYIRAAAERMAINAPIQGTEADIIKLAMVRVEEFLKEKKLDGRVHPLLQVHDELVYEIEEGMVQIVAPEIKRIMESVIDPKKTYGVVCETTVAVGKSWGEMEPLGVAS